MQWTASQIKEKLTNDDRWLIRGLLAIYNHQTYDEQQSQETKHNNGIGFNGVDANILSSFAQQYKTKNFLSPKQVAITRKKMLKYAGQLANIANRKGN